MKKFLLSLALLCWSPAWAAVSEEGVLYNWVWDGSGPYESWGHIVVTEEAWLSGGVQWNSYDHYPEYADAPILRALLITSGGGNSIDGGDWMPEPGSLRFLAWFDFQFVGSGIAGSMTVDMVQEGESIGEGTAEGWSFRLYNTGDTGYGSACFGAPGGDEEQGCLATGRWVLDESTIPAAQVPLPATAALLGSGLLWAGFRRRH